MQVTKQVQRRFGGSEIPSSQDGIANPDQLEVKFLSVDPIAKRFPELSTYQFVGNSPIANVDLDGEEPKKANEKVQETWYGKVKTNTIDFLGAAYMTTVNVFGALSEIPPGRDL